MKYFIKPLGLAAALTVSGVAMASDADVAAQLKAMQERLDRLENENANLKSSVAGQEYITRDEFSRLMQNELSTTIDERIATGFAAERDSAPMLTLGSGIDNLTIKGDLRLRYERRERSKQGASDDSRDRMRTRLRIGGLWESEGWEVGVGVATGDDADATSTNDTWSDSSPFNKSNLWIDYAYAAHTFGDFKVTLGQQKNPYESEYILWDGDVRPIGATVGYKNKDLGIFATAGVYDVREYGSDQSAALMGAGQVGYGGKYDQLDYQVAVAYYHFSEVIQDTVTTANDPDYTFSIIDLNASANYKFDDVKIGVYGEIFQNLAAEGTKGQVSGVKPDDADLAWILGAKAGYQGFTLNYSYAHIEADAVLAGLTDSDFGAGVGSTTDVEGHKISLSYKVNKNLELAGTAFFVEPIKRPATTRDEGQLYQLDAVWKF